MWQTPSMGSLGAHSPGRISSSSSGSRSQAQTNFTPLHFALRSHFTWFSRRCQVLPQIGPLFDQQRLPISVYRCYNGIDLCRGGLAGTFVPMAEREDQHDQAAQGGAYMPEWEWEEGSILYARSPDIPPKDIFQAVCREVGRYYQKKGLRYLRSKRELKWNGLNLRCQLGLWSSHSNIRGEWVNLEIVASFFALDLSGMERNGILTIGLRPKNFNIYGIDLAQFHEIILYIDDVIQIAGELDTHDGLEKYFLTISKEDFAAASTNNAQYMGNLLGTEGI